MYTTLNQYLEDAKVTNKIMEEDYMIFHMLIGISSEIGELLEAIKKRDIINVKEELGDLAWLGMNLWNIVDQSPRSKKDNPHYTPYLSSHIVEINHIKLNFITKLGNNLFRKWSTKLLSQFTIIQGDIQTLIKKTLIYGKPLDVNEFNKLMKSYFQAWAQICHSYNFQIKDVLHSNISKLKARYADKYTDAEALNRDLKKELNSLK